MGNTGKEIISLDLKEFDTLVKVQKVLNFKGEVDEIISQGDPSSEYSLVVYTTDCSVMGGQTDFELNVVEDVTVLTLHIDEDFPGPGKSIELNQVESLYLVVKQKPFKCIKKSSGLVKEYDDHKRLHSGWLHNLRYNLEHDIIQEEISPADKKHVLLTLQDPLKFDLVLMLMEMMFITYDDLDHLDEVTDEEIEKAHVSEILLNRLDPMVKLIGCKPLINLITVWVWG